MECISDESTGKVCHRRVCHVQSEHAVARAGWQERLGTGRCCGTCRMDAIVRYDFLGHWYSLEYPSPVSASVLHYSSIHTAYCAETGV